MGISYRAVFNNGQDMVFLHLETSEVGKFHRFVVLAHSQALFDVRPNFVDIRGTELFVKVEGGQTDPAQIVFGIAPVISPSTTSGKGLPLFLAGWIKDLVENLKYEYGAGNCGIERFPAGICNNPNPLFGSANISLRRLKAFDPAYADGVSAPSGPTQISPRLISNIVFREESKGDDGKNKLHLTDSFVFFGQFIDHDVGISPVGAFSSSKQPLFSVSRSLFAEDLPISVPSDDPDFEAGTLLPFERSVWRREGNTNVVPREILNSITAYLDLSQVYGSDNIRRKALRSFKDGLLETSQNDFLPFNGNVEGGVGIALENAPTALSRFYVAGDIRALENPNLAALHVLWLREHNKVAKELDKAFGGELDDETLFRYARDVCIAEYQSIVFSEWVPLLLGQDVVVPERYEYDQKVDPSLDAFFTTASFRFGHSMVSGVLWRLEEGETVPRKTVPLRDVFFNPDAITPENIDDTIRGMAWHEARELDEKVIDDLRSFLFTDKGAPSMDLVALNIQRGRDVGLPSYNQARQAYDLPAAVSFEDISDDAQTVANLKKAYEVVDNVDPFVGGLAETAPEGRLFGELFQASLSDQFRRLRDGDRLFYKDFPFPKDLVDAYPRLQSILSDKVKLANVVERNTGIKESDLLRGRQSMFQLAME
ncbi:hypothetical protein BSKO_04350 [Bryopsis sp. KO-2023]|nr:hypothetical protein BSKO_04350 [Bryopsis sp. KO-2023]